MRLHNKLNSEKSTFGNLFDKKKNSGKELPKFSLNMTNRKKEIVRISEENLRIVQRLQDIKGEAIVKKKKRTKSQTEKSMSRGIGSAPSISVSTFYRRKMSRASGRQLLDQL